MPLRRADDAARAQRAQHPPRRRDPRLHARPRRDQGADRRPRIRARSCARRWRCAKAKPLVIDYDDPEYARRRRARSATLDYEAFIAGAIPASPGRRRATSGTRSRSTTRPARPAIRRASSTIIAARICSRTGNIITAGMAKAPGLSLDAADVPLQWLVLSLDDRRGGRHACVPAPGAREADLRPDGATTASRICAARRSSCRRCSTRPRHEKQPLPHVVEFFTAAAPPPEAVLAAMARRGFNVTHLYGLTETLWPGRGQRMARRLGRARSGRAGRARKHARACATRARSARRHGSRRRCSRCRPTARPSAR